MKRPIGVATVVLVGVIAVGCDSARSTAPTITGPLFAAATTTTITASAPLTIADPGTIRVSGGVVHVRDLVLVGPVSGDITGTIETVGNLNVMQATSNGTAFGTFTITEAAGAWDGRFQGSFDAGVFSGTLVARGSGEREGLILRGSLAQTSPTTNVVQLTGTILNPGG